MPRKPTPVPVSKETPVNALVIQDDIAATNQLAVMKMERQQRLTDLASQLGYQGSLGGEALMDGARASKRRVGMAIMEFGAYLLLLKEGCEHGQFEQVLTDLEIVPSTARNYMALTRRLAKRSTSDVLDSIGYGKAAELLGLDDDQIDELAEAGATGELALDDVARMSVRELRGAVRKERAVKDRLKTVNDELNTELALKKNMVVAATDWPDAFKVLMDQAQFAHKNLKIVIGSLDAIREEAMKATPQGPDEEASLERARAVLAEEMLNIHKSAAEYLEALGMSFDKTLGSFASKGLYQ